MKKKRIKAVITGILTAAMVITGILPGLGSFGGVTALADDTSISSPRLVDNSDGSTTVTWDTVTMGSYVNRYDAYTYPIKWRILDVDDGTGYALVVADRVLDYKRFSYNFGTFWRDSDIRTWMNGDFLNEIFTSEEQAAIPDTTLTGTYDTQVIETTDKMFFLSYDDVINSAYGFINDASRACGSTEYCAGLGSSGGYNWWLRTSSFDGSSYRNYAVNNGHIR
nr:DUF6273 domain-containing protein [Eubacterium sp.]